MVVYFYSALANCLPTSVRLKFTSQKLVPDKISNKHPFAKEEVVGSYLRMGAYSRGRLFNNLADGVGA